MKVYVKFYVIIKRQEEYDKMSYALTFISVACTVASVIGAIRSNIYYTKSKNLTIYANTNVAYIESKKIINTLTEILKIAGSINKSIPKKRGIN